MRTSGDWNNDMRHGWGRLVWADGNTYEGGWKNDNISPGTKGLGVFAFLPLSICLCLCLRLRLRLRQRTYCMLESHFQPITRIHYSHQFKVEHHHGQRREWAATIPPATPPEQTRLVHKASLIRM